MKEISKSETIMIDGGIRLCYCFTGYDDCEETITNYECVMCCSGVSINDIIKARESGMSIEDTIKARKSREDKELEDFLLGHFNFKHLPE